MFDNIDIVLDDPSSGIPPTPPLLGVSPNSGKKVCAGRRCGQKREPKEGEWERAEKGGAAASSTYCDMDWLVS